MVSNFTVKRSGTRMISCSLFNELGEGSVIRNVSFDNVTYELLGISESVKTVKVSSLAKSANGTTVSNVSISGKLVTNYDSEFPMLQKPFYEEDSTGEVNGFIADIAVEQQAQ